MFNKYFSKVVIGTWSLSGDLGFVSKKNVISTIEACVENNFLEFDTAPTYGKGSVYKVLNDVLKNVNGVKINTKCGYNSHFVKTFKIQDIIDSIDNSLHVFKKINTLFLHNPRNEIKEWSKLFNILNAYKKKNFINSIGISFARDCYFEKKIMNQFDYFQDEINPAEDEQQYYNTNGGIGFYKDPEAKETNELTILDSNYYPKKKASPPIDDHYNYES
jgi:aryl-alcohol dehydrogenase-like predicted oxidoreductase